MHVALKTVAAAALLLVTVSLVVPLASADTSVLRLGGLFPRFKTAKADFSKDGSGIQRLSAFVMAINELNDKTDGLWDDVLPNTQIEYSVRDSKRDAGVAFFQAFNLVTEAFGKKGVHAVVGPASSGPTMNSNLVFREYDTAQISYSATSPNLSDRSTYTSFFRTPPSDAFQGEALAEMIAKHFKWERVATLSSTDGYGAAGIAAFQRSAEAQSLTLLTAQNFAKDAATVKEQLVNIKNTGARIIVMMCQFSDAQTIFKEAEQEGMLGDGYTWIGGDAIAGSMVKLNDVVQDKLMLKGIFGMVPTSGVGSTFTNLVTRWKAQKSTAGFGPGNCDSGTDSDGNLIWQQDHDADATTPVECAGVDFAIQETINSYAPYAYDATIALAKAVHQLVEVEKKTTIVPKEIVDALYKVSFTGATGTVDWDDGVGDRTVGAKYNILNHDGSAVSTVGSWEKATGTTLCTAGTTGCVAVAYSTDDNSVPKDRAAICKSGQKLKDGVQFRSLR
eukprot:GFYU01002728.1.p1 GENE.GFYU01002728.1~~GFYU01002728.1.p1  ORF type:complete len:504 (-),score=141.53 GFYU01002728.1:225-1736(-)